jgi:hypothetical protein
VYEPPTIEKINSSSTPSFFYDNKENKDSLRCSKVVPSSQTGAASNAIEVHDEVPNFQNGAELGVASLPPSENLGPFSSSPESSSTSPEHSPSKLKQANLRLVQKGTRKNKQIQRQMQQEYERRKRALPDRWALRKIFLYGPLAGIKEVDILTGFPEFPLFEALQYESSSIGSTTQETLKKKKKKKKKTRDLVMDPSQVDLGFMNILRQKSSELFITVFPSGFFFFLTFLFSFFFFFFSPFSSIS